MPQDMEASARIVAVVEDEVALRENYVSLLQDYGYVVWQFSNRMTAIERFEQELPDLALIDIGLELELDGGFRLCQQIRGLSQSLPIIFLTARDGDIDTISGLRLGADDYLSKDISLAHLMARIDALFRRLELQETSAPQSDILRCQALELDLRQMRAQWQGQNLGLTVTEFWMLHSIAQRPGHVKSREQLMDDSKMVVDDSTITSHIKRIRKKFIRIDMAFDAIETVYGMGYRWRV
jgi:two-component system OmpR family response regulator